MGTEADEPSDDDEHDENVINWKVAMNTVQDDYELLTELLDSFLVEGPRLMRRINDAIRNDDIEELRIAAHTIKSSFRYFGAAQAQQLAFGLETLARTGTMQGAADQAQQLNAAWPSVERTLKKVPPREQLRQL